MRELDRTVIENYDLTAEVLMENAGYQVADFLRSEFSTDVKIAFVCGQGNNGGDGFTAARRLASWGYQVQVYTPFEKNELSDLALRKLEAVEKIEDIRVESDFPTANIYVDALIGYGLEGAPRGPADGAVRKIRDWGAEIVSIDVPTGIDADTGEVHKPAVKPNYTISLGLPKKGLDDRGDAGKILLADIGIPPQAMEEVGVEKTRFFENSSLVELEDLRR